MIWNVCFAISIVIIIAGVISAIAIRKKYRRGQLLNAFNRVFVGVAIAVFVGLIPVFAEMLEGDSAFAIKIALFDVIQTMQVFTVNVGGDFILDYISDSTYSTLMSILFFIAPIMTFGFLFSLFKNAIAGVIYAANYWKETFVFSDLNEKSLMLAGDIKRNHPGSQLVFTNVDAGDESADDFIESAKELNALIFKKDIDSVDFSKHSRSSSISFFAIGEAESDNLISALKLINSYKDRENTNLYVFSTGNEGELLLSNAKKGKMKVRRVNEIRSVIYRYLYEDGCEIFENAIQAEEHKEINITVLGLGRYGTELTRALTWYGQMDGYSINIHAYDQDELAEEKFAALCPELMSEKYNGVKILGESEYTITIHSGVDVSTRTFADLYKNGPKATTVFVCLGDDAENINQAANVRMLSERYGFKPVIKPVVYNLEENEALKGTTNYRGQAYGIDAIGNLEQLYSEDVLLGSELELLALERHLKWGEEEEFWQYEYNYRSSMASAVHMKARVACGMAGAGKTEDQLTDEERDIIERLEHRRWNTYMRSEGYVYSGSPDKSSRNDLAKVHHDLVDFDSLAEEEKRKDSKVGSL